MSPHGKDDVIKGIVGQPDYYPEVVKLRQDKANLEADLTAKHLRHSEALGRAITEINDLRKRLALAEAVVDAARDAALCCRAALAAYDRAKEGE